MNINTELHWKKAEIISKSEVARRKERFEHILEELKSSCPTALYADDFNYYAGELSYLSGEEYTPNKCRQICMEGKGLNSFDMIDSFVGDDTDSIIDFF